MTNPYRVIALAASAGGLVALGEVLSRLPANLRVPVLIVQHISRDHVSHTPYILDRRTELKVKAAEEGEAIEPGVAYVATPDRHLLVRPDGTLTLAQTERVRFSRPSADVLFRSCAESYGEGVIAVVLSGAGRDGADGALAIERAGGTVIVQDPETADHPSMPEAAIIRDHPSCVLPLEEIAPRLLALLQQTSAPEET